MGIFQFLRIFWARRLIILAATISCLVGALIVCMILPPRWEAHSRVMLNIMKPDPVTGEVIAGPSAGLYVETQVELITDFSVAGKVAEQLGWLSDPNLILQYQKRSANDKRDFRRWLADLVINNTKAKLVENSNILEISYTGPTADNAKAVADALRKAYMDASLSFRREDAERNAEWYEGQMDKAKETFDQAVAAQSAFERANGIVMANDKTDVESARLQALSMQGSPQMTAPAAAMPSLQSATQLAAIDAQIATASKVLGPNNPEMQDLKARRAALAIVVAQDKAAQRAAFGAMTSNVSAMDRAVAAQKSKVIAQGDKIARLSQLQSDADLRHEEYIKTAAKVAQYREEAAVADAGLTPLGSAATPKGPVFPNYWLIVPGALVLGLAVGMLVALLMELFGRRVRSAEDLGSIDDVPFIGVIAAPAKKRSTEPGRTRARPGWWPARRGMARA